MIYKILFLCTGNTARSILAEMLLNTHGQGQFIAHSAGSAPKGSVHPEVLKICQNLNYDGSRLSSKTIDQALSDMQAIPDFVITLCDSAAKDPCPIVLTNSHRAHWSFPDPAVYPAGSLESQEAFAMTYQTLEKCIRAFIQLPFAEMATSDILEAIKKDRLLQDKSPQI